MTEGAPSMLQGECGLTCLLMEPWRLLWTLDTWVALESVVRTSELTVDIEGSFRWWRACF